MSVASDEILTEIAKKMPTTQVQLEAIYDACVNGDECPSNYRSEIFAALSTHLKNNKIKSNIGDGGGGGVDEISTDDDDDDDDVEL